MRTRSTFTFSFLTLTLATLAGCNNSLPGTDRNPRDASSHRYDPDTYSAEGRPPLHRVDLPNRQPLPRDILNPSAYPYPRQRR